MHKIAQKIKSLPDTPGVYLFYKRRRREKSKFICFSEPRSLSAIDNSKKELIYVGKATSLRDRVRSYFRSVIPSAGSGQALSESERSLKFRARRDSSTPLRSVQNDSHGQPQRPIEVMIHEVVDIKIAQTDSVLEAVILEGNLIKKFRPKYNVDWKDDKSWNYIVITDDEFPRVITVRERELERIRNANPPVGGTKLRKNQKQFNNLTIQQFTQVFGPYPGLNTKATMKILRRIFKFSECIKDKGIRSKEKLKPCFYYQIGECLGVCTGEISSAQYKQKVIKPLTMFLSGNKKGLLKSLNIKMKLAARIHNFEEAGRLRDQIKALQRIQDVAMLNEGLVARDPLCVSPLKGGGCLVSPPLKEGVGPAIKAGQGGGLGQMRIEGYDISNLGVSDKVGSMVVFDNDGPIKSEYKKFNIKTVVGQSDMDCLREVLQRRLRHSEWPLPDIFLIDGGLAQVNAVMKIVGTGRDLSLPRVTPVIVGIAKGAERKRNDFFITNGKSDLKLLEWIKNNKKLLIQVRDEAHRFAIAFNRSKRKLK